MHMIPDECDMTYMVNMTDLYDMWYYVCFCDCVKYMYMILIWMNYMIDKMHRYDMKHMIEKDEQTRNDLSEWLEYMNVLW